MHLDFIHAEHVKCAILRLETGRHKLGDLSNEDHARMHDPKITQHIKWVRPPRMRIYTPGAMDHRALPGALCFGCRVATQWGRVPSN